MQHSIYSTTPMFSVDCDVAPSAFGRCWIASELLPISNLSNDHDTVNLII